MASYFVNFRSVKIFLKLRMNTIVLSRKNKDQQQVILASHAKTSAKELQLNPYQLSPALMSREIYEWSASNSSNNKSDTSSIARSSSSGSSQAMIATSSPSTTATTLVESKVGTIMEPSDDTLTCCSLCKRPFPRHRQERSSFSGNAYYTSSGATYFPGGSGNAGYYATASKRSPPSSYFAILANFFK